MERIKSITEAFSMQPEILEVYTLNDTEYYNSHCIGEKLIKEIKLEDKYLDGELLECYVGYNFEGSKLFQYIAKSVNVKYF